MDLHNFEFKARVKDIEQYEQKLLELSPFFKGEDHQTDTYFNVSKGRLKLREGKIENALIFYERSDLPGAKEAKIILYRHNPDNSLKKILEKTLGVKVVVEKIRRIYFIENIKFHFDIVRDLGSFIEVEAIDESGYIGNDILKEQCSHYSKLFNLSNDQYVSDSYSDMILDMDNQKRYGDHI